MLGIFLKSWKDIFGIQFYALKCQTTPLAQAKKKIQRTNGSPVGRDIPLALIMCPEFNPMLYRFVSLFFSLNK